MIASPGTVAALLTPAPAIYPYVFAFGAGNIFLGSTTGTLTEVKTLLPALDLIESAAIFVNGTVIPFDA